MASRHTVVSDSRYSGVRPCPRTQGGGRPEPADVTDLSDQDCSGRRADPLDLLDRPAPLIATHPVADLALEQHDVAVVGIGELTQRRDPERIRVTKRWIVELHVLRGTEHVGDDREHQSLECQVAIPSAPSLPTRRAQVKAETTLKRLRAPASAADRQARRRA